MFTGIRGGPFTWLGFALGLLAAAAMEGRCAEPEYPLSIAVSPVDQSVYLADRDLPGVWRIDQGKATLYFQAEKRFRTPLNAIRCLEFDREGRLLAGDSATRDVYRFDEAGTPQPLTREAENPFGQVGIPMDLTVNQQGEIFVSDLETQRVVRIAAAGGAPAEVAKVAGCRGLFVDAQDQLWILATTGDQLRRLGPDGQAEVIVKADVFEFPHTVVVDGAGTAYVCDGYAKAVWKIPPGGAPEKWVQGPPLVNPVGMAWNNDQLLVVDPRARGVFQIDTSGNMTPVPFSVEN